MRYRWHFNFLKKQLNRPDLQLSAVWLAGLLIGILLSSQMDRSIFTALRPILSERTSIIYHFAIVALPFLFAAYCIAIHKSKLLFFICFLKAVHFSFCGHLLYHAYGSAGWLVRFLLQFTEIFTMPILFAYCLRNISCGYDSAQRDLLICLILVAFMSCIDYFVISPLGFII